MCGRLDGSEDRYVSPDINELAVKNMQTKPDYKKRPKFGTRENIVPDVVLHLFLLSHQPCVLFMLYQLAGTLALLQRI